MSRFKRRTEEEKKGGKRKERKKHHFGTLGHRMNANIQARIRTMYTIEKERKKPTRVIMWIWFLFVAVFFWSHSISLVPTNTILMVLDSWFYYNFFLLLFLFLFVMCVCRITASEGGTISELNKKSEARKRKLTWVTVENCSRLLSTSCAS